MRYLDIHYPIRPINQKYAERVAEWLNKRFFIKPGKILDIGCGRCYYTNGFKKLGFEISACDIEPEENPFDIKVDKVDLEKDKLPYNDTYFDYIFCNAVLEHLGDPHLMLSEMKRVLKNGGSAFILTTNWKKIL
ncbi:MAG: class I SAM-dependent methyltransferase [Candidatus Aenigmatarchaeota archaeon]